MHRFNHEPTVIVPSAPILSDQFFERIFYFYDEQPDVPNSKSDIWKGVEESCQGQLKKSLLAHDPIMLRKVLEELYLSDLPAGLDVPKEVDQNEYGALCNTAILDLAVACGVLPRFSPEQDNSLGNLTQDGLVSAIETVLNGTLTHPGGGKMRAVQVGDRVIPFKLLEGATVFVSMKRLCAEMESVWEIGGGFGWIGYLIYRFNPKAHYYSSDLPLMSVLSGFLLATALGEQAVRFADEHQSEARIHILGLDSKSANVVAIGLNVNSFPEIPFPAQTSYIKDLAGSLLSGSFFLSVNHESAVGSQRRVFSAMQAHLHQFRLVSRTPAFGRNGYIQEIWKRL